MKHLIISDGDVVFYDTRVVESGGLSACEIRYVRDGRYYRAISIFTAAWVGKSLTEIPTSFNSIEDIADIKEIGSSVELLSIPWITKEYPQTFLNAFDKVSEIYCKRDYPWLVPYIGTVKGVIMPRPLVVVSLVEDNTFLGSIEIVDGEIRPIIVASRKMTDILQKNGGERLYGLRLE